jgi:signal transduction histidine kinase
MKSSIKGKLILTALIMTVIGVVISSWFLVKREENALITELEERANALTDNLARNCEYGLVTLNRENLHMLANSTLQQKDIYSVRVENNKNEILAEAGKKDLNGPFKEFFMPIKTERHAGSDEEMLLLNVKEEKKQIGKAVVILSLSSLNKKLDELKKTIFIFGLSIIIFVFLAINFMVDRYIVYPINELISATQKVAAGDLDYKIAVKLKDEFGLLVVFFNRMTEDLSKSRLEIEEYSKTLEQKVDERTKELMESKEKLYQTSKMAAVGQLAGGVAHEINNPMGVILGFAQVIAKSVKEGEPLYMPLKSIEREALRCKHLVENLLTFSRINKIDKETMDMNDVIDWTLKLVEAQAKVKDVRIIREYAADLQAIKANKQQLQQVFVNLCNNAIDAMPGGGKITITTLNHPRQKDESGAEQNGFVEISIADTGQGIAKEIKDHIFEPFFTTKEIGKGTGLGLSLCYEIIQKHKGTIEAESPLKEGVQGTRFRIKLPVEPAG